jgi:hypothetical protein
MSLYSKSLVMGEKVVAKMMETGKGLKPALQDIRLCRMGLSLDKQLS